MKRIDAFNTLLMPNGCIELCYLSSQFLDNRWIRCRKNFCQSLFIVESLNVYTLGDLVVFLERDLCKFKNMGSKGIEEIKSLVAQKGMHLGMRIKASPLRADWTYKLYYINSNH